MVEHGAINSGGGQGRWIRSCLSVSCVVVHVLSLDCLQGECSELAHALALQGELEQ